MRAGAYARSQGRREPEPREALGRASAVGAVAHHRRRADPSALSSRSIKRASRRAGSFGKRPCQGDCTEYSSRVQLCVLDLRIVERCITPHNPVQASPKHSPVRRRRCTGHTVGLSVELWPQHMAGRTIPCRRCSEEKNCGRRTFDRRHRASVYLPSHYERYRASRRQHVAEYGGGDVFRSARPIARGDASGDNRGV